MYRKIQNPESLNLNYRLINKDISNMHMTTSMKVYKFIAKIGTAIAKTADASKDFLDKIGLTD